MGTQKPPKLPLPKRWRRHVRSAMLHVISLAQFATVYTRGWAANSVNSRIRLKAELERANQEIALLREEIRIKDARLVFWPSEIICPIWVGRLADPTTRKGCKESLD